MKGEDMDSGLRDVLLPNRTEEEVRLQLARVKKNNHESRKRSKLLDLQKEESEKFVVEEQERNVQMEKDYQRRRRGMDDILGLATTEHAHNDESEIGDKLPERRKGNTVKASLDQVLGLVVESEEQRKRRELDEALGLC
jgi:hypothetical protein